MDEGSRRTPRFRTRSRRGLRSLAAGRWPRAGTAADARGRAGRPPGVRHRVLRRASCAASTATWSWSAASTPRRPPSSARASSASGRQLLGQEAAQVGAGRALRPQDFVFPTYREHGVAWCRGVDPIKLLGLFRGVDHGGWDPEEYNFDLYTIVIGAQTLHATGYAMGMQRDGAVGTVTRPRLRGDRVLRRRRLAARATSTRRSSSPRSTTRRSSSSARTTSGRSPSRSSGRPGCRSTSARSASASPASASTATTCSRVRRHAGRAAAGPRRPGPDPRRGVHLPHGRPHHLRRPDPVPGRRATSSPGS